MRRFVSMVIMSAVFGAGGAQAQALGRCGFNAASLRFAGTTAETLSCLLRKVREQGGGADAQPIPAWLSDHAAQPISVSSAQVRDYLQRKAIAQGDLTVSLAQGDRPSLRYFVIHDTSSPEIPSTGTAFPSNINAASWSGNRLSGWNTTALRVNLITSRDGQSRPMRDWGDSRSLAATKLENRIGSSGWRVFAHVENIQPRIKPPNKWAWIAPTPGFGPAQEERLALAYVVASLRAGRWLIPAYHFNLDQGFPDGHDDPQHADLASWVARIAAIEADIRSGQQ